MRTCTQGYARFGDRLPSLPATRVGYGLCPGDVSTVYFKVERRTCIHGGYAEVKIIGACCIDIDHVLGPLARRSPANIVAATGIRCCLDVYTIPSTILSTLVSCFQVMLSDPFAACIVLLEFNLSRNRPGGSAERRFRATRSAQAKAIGELSTRLTIAVVNRFLAHV